MEFLKSNRPLLAALLLLLLPCTAFADAFFTYGVSPRTIGMGNAFSATADDWTGAYYNPGGVALQHRPVLGVGYMANFANLNYIGKSEAELDESRAMIFGANFPLPFDSGFLKDRFTFGVTGYMPEGRLLQMRVNAPAKPSLILLQNAHRTNAMYPAFGIQLTKGLGIGGGVQTFIDTIGEINAFIDPAGNVQTEVGEELLVTYSPTAGVLFKPGEHWEAMKPWSFGFVFRDESFTRYQIPVGAVLDQIPFIVTFNAKSIFTPRQYLLAMAYQLGRWRLEGDASFNEWSRFPDPNLNITVTVDIPIIPLNFINSIKREPKFHDTFSGRVGTEVSVYEHAKIDLLARGGYMFDPSPVPPQTGYTNQLDADRHVGALSFGCKWKGVGDTQFGAPLLLDLVWQTQYLPRRVAYKNESVSTDNPGYPKIGLEGWLHFVGISLSTYFDYE
ncbi:MAG: hypothetical protein GX444_02885 [Myxococcales bacterium]|nr:hypothetical protein [Myxococcales bacterium]